MIPHDGSNPPLAIPVAIHGKVILCGEHFVLFGSPALALPWKGGELRLLPASGLPEGDAAGASRLLAAWNLARESVGLPVDGTCSWAVDSTIPPGAGLGSSAALSVALVRAACLEAGTRPGNEWLIRVATQVEGVFHGRSSGLDPAVVILERPVICESGGDPRPLPWRLPPLDLVLALAGGTRRTVDAVDHVRSFASERPGRFKEMLDAAAELVREVATLLSDPHGLAGAPRLGALLTRNHVMLAELGVSPPALERLVAGALSAGAYGAKLCGAGLGGVVLALPPPGGVDIVSAAMVRAGAARVWSWTVEGDGEVGT